MQWLLDHFVTYIEEGFVYVVNAVISALGAFMAFVLNLLPGMPSQPTIPSAITTASRVAYEACDVGWLLAYISTFLTLMASVFVIMIALRWIKAAD
jgi:hypothetical protein